MNKKSQISGSIEKKARLLLKKMTLDEKISQMSGDLGIARGLIAMSRIYYDKPIPSGKNTRLMIPAISFTDGPRGVVMNHSTSFPVSIARGSSWDTGLEERIGDVIGIEALAQGANFFGGVCINLLRHPAWGRAQETYGEDPFHAGEMGAALVRGVQRHIMACIKHFACNSIENTRFRVDVRIKDRTLHEIYLPHFKRCIEEGAASVMSAYNKVNGEHCGQNRRLLTEILKKEMGFEGFVISDFILGIHDGKAAIMAGLDIEMPFPLHYGKKLKRLVRNGVVPVSIIDEAVLRILRMKILFCGKGKKQPYGHEVIACKAHRELALEAAVKSAVLLKNEPVGGKAILPVDPVKIRKIALIGKLAFTPNTGDSGSSIVRPPYTVTPQEGLSRRAMGIEIICCEGADLRYAAGAAGSADMAIVVAGLTDEGEFIPAIPFFSKSKGGDRQSLTLHPHDEALILAVSAANPRTAVVLQCGSSLITEAWRDNVPAILVQWYAGMEGGAALAELVFGYASPGGKLPCIFPKNSNQLPFFDSSAGSIDYGYYHGYRLLEKSGEEPAFAFGFGLSYTAFEISRLRTKSISIKEGGTLEIAVCVRNTGGRPGDEVIQLYAGCINSDYDRPIRELKGFKKVFLQPGESRTLAFKLPSSALGVWDGGWVIEKKSYRLWAGNSSRQKNLLETEFRIV